MGNLEKNNELLEQLKEKDNYILHLEKLVNAYKNLSDLYNKELLEADKMLQAQEIIQNLADNDRSLLGDGFSR